MNRIFTIAQRELTSIFSSPVAYVTLGLFAVCATFAFFTSFVPGQQATMRPTFEWVVWWMIFLVPALSMRLISEEFRNGTVENLLTAPLGEMHIVLGKFLGAFGFFCILLFAPLIVLTCILEFSSDPEYGPIFTGFFGLLLVGGLYLAIGIFASAATKDQIISFLLTVFIICLFTIALQYLAVADFVSNDVARALRYINITSQYEDFGKGILSLSSLIYFTTSIGLFLFMAVKVLESRRWR